MGDLNFIQPIYPVNAELGHNSSNMTTNNRIYETTVPNEFNSFSMVPHVNVMPDKSILRLDPNVSPIA